MWLSEDVIQLIKSIPPPHPSERPDKISWSHTSSRAFFVKFAYRFFNESIWNPRVEKWKIPRPQIVRFFIWTALQGGLLSNVERVRRGLAVNPSCPICGHHSVDILHILKDCSTDKEVWNHFVK